MIVIMLGAPGVGKGVHASKLHDEYKLPHISTGELFRENMRNETPLGRQIKTFMDAGHLVPDELVLEMLFERVAKDDCKDGYILDGVPRTLPQAEALQKHLAGSERVVVLNLTASDEEVIQRICARLTCSECGALFNSRFSPPKEDHICDRCGGKLYQRADDTEEVVHERLRVYREQTEPVREYYSDLGMVVDIDSSRAADEVFEDLTRLLAS